MHCYHKVEDDEEKDATHLLLEVNLTEALTLPKVKDSHLHSQCIKMMQRINKADI